MKCPIDGAQLNIWERNGFEIDCCPQCRCDWLDRGELDKIVERSAATSLPQMSEQRREHTAPPLKRKKRESFLSELFDF